jgi:hypothetical protein
MPLEEVLVTVASLPTPRNRSPFLPAELSAVPRESLNRTANYGTDVQSVAEVEVLGRPLLEPEPVLLGHVLEDLGRLLEEIFLRFRPVIGNVA